MSFNELVHEIDIAGTITERGTVTVTAIGGKAHSYSVLLPARVNQQINELLGIDKMGERKQKQQNLKIYTAMIYLLIKSCPIELSGVVILDRDYDKRSIGKAKKAIKKLLKEDRVNFKCRIETGAVGKGAAHEVCNAVHSGRKEPDYVLHCEDCLSIMQRIRIT